jgi:hypothetical protein
MRSSLVSFLVVALSTQLAFAQTAPPDVVRKKDGGMVRGVIVEKDPKGSVTIMLPSGETRSIAMADVEYAGSTSEEPKKSDAPIAPTAPPVTPTPAPPAHVSPFGSATPNVGVDVVGREPNLVLYARRDVLRAPGGARPPAEQLRPLCTTPCKVALPVGRYVLGVSNDGSAPAPTAPVLIERESRLEVGVDPHRGQHIGGWITFGVSLGLGSIIVVDGLAGMSLCNLTESDSCVETIAGGLALAVVGGGIGLALALTSPDGTVRFLPGVASMPAHSDQLARAGERGSGSPEGMRMSVSF